jgi:hypothetical protein
MTYISLEQLQRKREQDNEILRKNAEAHEVALEDIRELREHPERLTAAERDKRFKRAKKMTADQEVSRNNQRYFTKEDANGNKVNYSAFVYPEAYAPAGNITSNFAEGASEAAQFLQNMWGNNNMAGRANTVIFAMDSGDVIAIRRIQADDPKLPPDVLQRHADARARGIDPNDYADLQYFEVRSSKSLRTGQRESGQGKLIHSSAFDEMVVIPGLPLKFSKDERSGVAPPETEEAVSAIIALNDTDSGEVPAGRQVAGTRSNVIVPKDNIDGLRAEVGRALGTGQAAVRGLGKYGLRQP